jgi:hypothetical protein
MLWSQMTFLCPSVWKIAPPTSRSSPKTPPHLSVHFCSLPPTFQSTPNAYPSFGPILCFYFDVINKIQKLISTLILHCRCVCLHIHIFLWYCVFFMSGCESAQHMKNYISVYPFIKRGCDPSNRFNPATFVSNRSSIQVCMVLLG